MSSQLNFLTVSDFFNTVFFGTIYWAFFRPINEMMEYNSKRFGKIYGYLTIYLINPNL
jgi:hypothetical protein